MGFFEPTFVNSRAAEISPCGAYRYWLSRTWSRLLLRTTTFVMLNPSTADADVDDPTIRKCIGFAKIWGYGGIVVVNLFALRSTSPKQLWNVSRPIGEDNNYYLFEACKRANKDNQSITCAWGHHGSFQARDLAFIKLAHRCGVRLEALHINKTGAPRHPLYVPYTTKSVPYGVSPDR